MSDTCIVCLGDLSLGLDGVARQSTGALAKSPTADAHAATTVSAGVELTTHRVDSADTDISELIAHLQPCGHDLHDECLKPWVERANSCPICRASFHLVELMHHVGGTVVSTYTVQDKTQVADVDPALFLEVPDEYDEDEVCQVCGEDDNEDILMYCDGCGKLWHTYCAELDEVPYASWFCENCAADPATDHSQRYGGPRNRGAAGRRRTRGMERRRRNHNATQDDGWNQVWQSVWSRLNIDLDFPFDDEESPATLMRRHRQAVESNRREHEAFELRMRVAEYAGAGNRFRAAQSSLLSGDSQRTSAPHPPRESAEEIAAWDAFAEAREDKSDPEPTPAPAPARPRKRKSRTTSPAQHASPTSPAREAKRRRTSTPTVAPPPPPQRVQRRPRPTLRTSSAHPNSPPPAPRTVLDSAAPSFLQSLLQEVEDSAGPSGPSLHRPLSRNPASPPAEQASPRPSSPATSNPSSPRALSATPPPPPINGFRPSSPPGLSSSIQPVYAQANFSPGPSGSTESPEKNADPPPPPPPQPPPLQQTGSRIPPQAALNIARPKPRRPQIPVDSSPSRTRSHDTSHRRKSLTADNKADVQKLVSAALRPHYHDHKISKDEYTTINRDVSRMLYDKIGDFEALDLEGKAKWAEVAGEEVNKAVTALRA